MTNRRQPFIINLLQFLSIHSGPIASLCMCHRTIYSVNRMFSMGFVFLHFHVFPILVLRRNFISYCAIILFLVTANFVLLLTHQLVLDEIP